eukprot:2139245-Prymnesium_polylepis.1
MRLYPPLPGRCRRRAGVSSIREHAPVHRVPTWRPSDGAIAAHRRRSSRCQVWFHCGERFLLH